MQENQSQEQYNHNSHKEKKTNLFVNLLANFINRLLQFGLVILACLIFQATILSDSARKKSQGKKEHVLSSGLLVGFSCFQFISF
jgi:hypothetical protein